MLRHKRIDVFSSLDSYTVLPTILIRSPVFLPISYSHVNVAVYFCMFVAFDMITLVRPDKTDGLSKSHADCLKAKWCSDKTLAIGAQLHTLQITLRDVDMDAFYNSPLMAWGSIWMGKLYPEELCKYNSPYSCPLKSTLYKLSQFHYLGNV